MDCTASIYIKAKNHKSSLLGRSGPPDQHHAFQQRHCRFGLHRSSKGSPIILHFYSAQGRTKTLTTWTNFPSSGSAVTTWNYDANRGWLNSKKYADNNGPSYTYTAAGKLKTRTWARGVVTTNSYNSAGQLSGIG
jgi:YD repeat-containing protein